METEDLNKFSGIIEAIDQTQGVGVISALNVGDSYVAFFLEDIEKENGWENGLGIGDCVEFETTSMTDTDHEIIHRSRDCQKYLARSNNNEHHSDNILSANWLAIRLKKLPDGSVILEEPLWGQPRYRGLVEKELTGDDIIDTKLNMYRESMINNCKGGSIRIVKPYFNSSIPPISQILRRPTNMKKNTNENEVSHNLNDGTMDHQQSIGNAAHSVNTTEEGQTQSSKHNFKSVSTNNSNNYHSNDNSDSTNSNPSNIHILEEGMIVPFDGSDLLSLRVVLEQGDWVEFDVYENKKDQTVGASNVVFLDANLKSREQGVIVEVNNSNVGGNLWQRHNRQNDYGRHGRIKRLNTKDFIYFHERELLDRDQPPNEGDDVEFVVRYDDVHDHEYAARITYLPSQYLRYVCNSRTSDVRFIGTVLEAMRPAGQTNTNETDNHKHNQQSHPKPATIRYRPREDRTETSIIQVSNEHEYISLVPGDKVSFRIQTSERNGVEEHAAVHVCVLEEAPRESEGRIFSVQNHFGFIEYIEKPERIFFLMREWISMEEFPICVGLKVEFNITMDGYGRLCAVRVRPVEWPLKQPSPGMGGHDAHYKEGVGNNTMVRGYNSNKHDNSNNNNNNKGTSMDPRDRPHHTMNGNTGNFNEGMMRGSKPPLPNVAKILQPFTQQSQRRHEQGMDPNHNREGKKPQILEKKNGAQKTYDRLYDQFEDRDRPTQKNSHETLNTGREKTRDDIKDQEPREWRRTDNYSVGQKDSMSFNQANLARTKSNPRVPHKGPIPTSENTEMTEENIPSMDDDTRGEVSTNKTSMTMDSDAPPPSINKDGKTIHRRPPLSQPPRSHVTGGTNTTHREHYSPTPQQYSPHQKNPPKPRRPNQPRSDLRWQNTNRPDFRRKTKPREYGQKFEDYDYDYDYDQEYAYDQYNSYDNRNKPQRTSHEHGYGYNTQPIEEKPPTGVKGYSGTVHSRNIRKGKNFTGGVYVPKNAASSDNSTENANKDA